MNSGAESKGKKGNVWGREIGKEKKEEDEENKKILSASFELSYSTPLNLLLSGSLTIPFAIRTCVLSLTPS